MTCKGSMPIDMLQIFSDFNSFAEPEDLKIKRAVNIYISSHWSDSTLLDRRNTPNFSWARATEAGEERL